MGHQSRPDVIKAVQFKRDNYNLVRSFFGDNFRRIYPSKGPRGASWLMFELDTGELYQVNDGQYIVLVNEKELSIMSEVEFKNKYGNL